MSSSRGGKPAAQVPRLNGSPQMPAKRPPYPWDRIPPIILSSLPNPAVLGPWLRSWLAPDSVPPTSPPGFAFCSASMRDSPRCGCDDPDRRVGGGARRDDDVVESSSGPRPPGPRSMAPGGLPASAGLVFLNVLAATLIRFPWRRRQAGFVVVHAGVLVLLAGLPFDPARRIPAALPVYEGVRRRDRLHGRSAARASALRVGNPSTSADGLKLARPGHRCAPQTVARPPFEPGPFNWSDYARDDAGWCLYPWRLVRRDQGVLYDADDIRLEVLDWRRVPEPLRRFAARPAHGRRAAAGLGRTDRRRPQRAVLAPGALTRQQGGSLSADERKVVQGDRRRAAVTLRHDAFDLGVPGPPARVRSPPGPGLGHGVALFQRGRFLHPRPPGRNAHRPSPCGSH